MRKLQILLESRKVKVPLPIRPAETETPGDLSGEFLP